MSEQSLFPEYGNLKRCTKCGRLGPFYNNKATKDGLSKWCKDCDNESSKRWIKNNPDKRKEISKRDNVKRASEILEWTRENSEVVRDRNNKWRLANLDKVRAKLRRYRTKKAGGGGSHTAEEFEEICKYYDYRCLCCGEVLPLEADHIIPVSKGGSSDIDNIQPLCRSCNASKGDDVRDYRY